MADLGTLGAVFGGSAIGSAVVRLVLDSSGYYKQLNAAHGQTQGGLSRMSRGISAFAAVGAAAFAAVGYAAIRFAADAVKAAAEEEHAHKMLALAVDGSTDGFLKQASALQALTGYQDDEIAMADAVLKRFKLTDEQVQDLIPHVLDYAAATGMDVTSAAENLGKALLGNTRALKTVGVEFTATGDRAADVQTIIAALSGSSIDGAASLDDLEHSQRVLNATWDDFKEQIGTELLPALQDLAESLTDIIPMLVDLAQLLNFRVMDEAAQELGSLVEQFQAGDISAHEFVAAIDELQDATNINTEVSAEFQAQIRKAWEEENRAAAVTRYYKNITDDAAESTQEQADAEAEAAAATRDHRLAKLALVDTYFAILDSAAGVAEAQKEVTRLEAHGKEGTKAYTQAVADAILAQAGLEEATIDYAAEGKDAQAVVRDLARDLNLNKETVNDLIASIEEYNRTDFETKRANIIVDIERYFSNLPGSGGGGGSAGGGGSGRGGGGQSGRVVIVNGDVYGYDDFARKVEQATRTSLMRMSEL